MQYVIRLEAKAGTVIDPRGSYLAAYDPDAYDGGGYAEWTKVMAQALRFASAGEAMACWRQQSMVRPLRDDGEPNRPLTAYSVTIEPVPERTLGDVIAEGRALAPPRREHA